MILLDTHIVVWLAVAPQRIRRRAQSAIRGAQDLGGVAISAASLWELADIAAKQRVRINTTPEAWVTRVVEASQVAVREITIEIAVTAAHLPPSFPADPFDRLIAATAMVERIPLVTSDGRIQDAKLVRTIW